MPRYHVRIKTWYVQNTSSYLQYKNRNPIRPQLGYDVAFKGGWSFDEIHQKEKNRFDKNVRIDSFTPGAKYPPKCEHTLERTWRKLNYRTRWSPSHFARYCPAKPQKNGVKNIFYQSCLGAALPHLRLSFWTGCFQKFLARSRTSNLLRTWYIQFGVNPSNVRRHPSNPSWKFQ